MIDSDNYWDMQCTVLGTIIRGCDKIGEVMAKLSESLFTDSVTHDVYMAIQALYIAKSPVDPMTVRKQAGAEYGDIVDEMYKHHYTDDILYYCDALCEYHLRLDIKLNALSLASSDSLQEAGQYIDAINGLMVKRNSVNRLSAYDAAMDFFSRQNSKNKPEYLTWGMDGLDKQLFVELGDFVLVGGYPSAGKTMLAVQMAIHLAKKYKVAFYSLETGTKKLEDRILSYMAQIPMSHIKRNELDEAEWRRANAACKALSELQIDLIQASGFGVSNIQADVLNQHYQVIFVDYLGIVQAAGKSRYEQVTNISLGLHQLAQSNGVTVVALQQLSRPEKEHGKPRPPTLSDFRESGQIEQDADVALLLYPSDPNDNTSDRVLKCSKNKDGGRFRLDLSFNGAIQRLTPIVEDSSKKVMRELQADGKAIKAKNRAAALAAQKEMQPTQVTFTELPGGAGSDLPF